MLELQEFITRITREIRIEMINQNGIRSQVKVILVQTVPKVEVSTPQNFNHRNRDSGRSTSAYKVTSSRPGQHDFNTK